MQEQQEQEVQEAEKQKPQLKVLHLDQMRKDQERARLMLLGIRLQLKDMK